MTNSIGWLAIGGIFSFVAAAGAQTQALSTATTAFDGTYAFVSSTPECRGRRRAGCGRSGRKTSCCSRRDDSGQAARHLTAGARRRVRDCRPNSASVTASIPGIAEQRRGDSGVLGGTLDRAEGVLAARAIDTDGAKPHQIFL